jgi:hypothetical protein
VPMRLVSPDGIPKTMNVGEDEVLSPVSSLYVPSG